MGVRAATEATSPPAAAAAAVIEVHRILKRPSERMVSRGMG